jgi:hypothetical protein
MKTLSLFLLTVLLIGLRCELPAADVSFYGVLKQTTFLQSSASAPALAPVEAFGFQAFVDSSQPDVITDAFLQLPGGGSRTLTSEGSMSFELGELFDSEGALNSAFGTGNYTLQIYSENDDFSFAQLAMPANNFPGAPFVTNFVAAQSINPSADFTVHWSGFTGGTASDFIQLRIQDSEDNTVFTTGEKPGMPGALNGTATEVLIPANTLSAGEEYEAEIFFARIVVSDTTSIPGARGVVAFGARTVFHITAAGEQTPLVLRAAGFSGGQFRLEMTTQPGKSYQIQFSGNLINWTNLYFTNATVEQTLVTDPFIPGGPNRFYRAYRTGGGN